MIRSLKIKSTLTALAAAALLAACGSSDDSTGTTLDVKGVVATGLAVEGGAVTVQCKAGSGSATTNATGSYSVIINNGEGPCLVTVTKDSLTLTSIAQFVSTDSAVANVTPITTAIVNAIAKAKGTNAAGLVGTQAPTAEEISTAATQVVAVLNLALEAAGSSIVLTADMLLSDPAFKAATANTEGSTLDKALDLLIPTGETELSEEIINEIDTVIDEVIEPTPTGATGGTGGAGGASTT